VNLGSASVHTFTAGPRIARELSNGMTAFGHLQAGIAIMHGSAFGVSASSTGFALIPGGGVDVPVARGLSLRVGGELTIVRDTDSWNGFRFITGIVMNK